MIFVHKIQFQTEYGNYYVIGKSKIISKNGIKLILQNLLEVIDLLILLNH